MKITFFSQDVGPLRQVLGPTLVTFIMAL